MCGPSSSRDSDSCTRSSEPSASTRTSAFPPATLRRRRVPAPSCTAPCSWSGLWLGRRPPTAASGGGSVGLADASGASRGSCAPGRPPGGTGRLGGGEAVVEEGAGGGVAGLLSGGAEDDGDDAAAVAGGGGGDAPAGFVGVAGLDAVGAPVGPQQVVGGGQLRAVDRD